MGSLDIEAVSAGVFQDVDALLRFCEKRSSICLSLLRSFAAGDDRFTQTNYEMAIQCLEVPSTLAQVAIVDTCILANKISYFWTALVEKANESSSVEEFKFADVLRQICSPEPMCHTGVTCQCNGKGYFMGNCFYILYI